MYKKALVLLFSVLLLAGCTQIEDGQVGISVSQGRISDDVLGAGWHTYNPFWANIEVWDTKIVELKESANVPSSEGLISTLDVSFLYNIPKDKAAYIRKTVSGDIATTLIEPYLREGIRNIASGYEVKALYSDAGRKEIGVKILNFMREKLEPRGINVQDVLLRDIKLPATFSASIENKLKAEQESLQKVYELQKATKDAEIEVAKAKGTAQANEIVGNSITSNYLKYLWIQGMQTNQMQVVYVPTEANLPILESQRWSETEKYNKK